MLTTTHDGFVVDLDARPHGGAKHTVSTQDGPKLIGFTIGYGDPIRAHDGRTIHRTKAQSPWRADAQVFWTQAGALFWLETIAASEMGH